MSAAEVSTRSTWWSCAIFSSAVIIASTALALSRQACVGNTRPGTLGSPALPLAPAVLPPPPAPLEAPLPPVPPVPLNAPAPAAPPVGAAPPAPLVAPLPPAPPFALRPPAPLVAPPAALPLLPPPTDPTDPPTPDAPAPPTGGGGSPGPSEEQAAGASAEPITNIPKATRRWGPIAGFPIMSSWELPPRSPIRIDYSATEAELQCGERRAANLGRIDGPTAGVSGLAAAPLRSCAHCGRRSNGWRRRGAPQTFGRRECPRDGTRCKGWSGSRPCR